MPLQRESSMQISGAGIKVRDLTMNECESFRKLPPSGMVTDSHLGNVLPGVRGSDTTNSPWAVLHLWNRAYTKKHHTRMAIVICGLRQLSAKQPFSKGESVSQGNPGLEWNQDNNNEDGLAAFHPSSCFPKSFLKVLRLFCTLARYSMTYSLVI